MMIARTHRLAQQTVDPSRLFLDVSLHDAGDNAFVPGDRLM
jgi:hypothetical protein